MVACSCLSRGQPGGQGGRREPWAGGSGRALGQGRGTAKGMARADGVEGSRSMGGKALPLAAPVRAAPGWPCVAVSRKPGAGDGRLQRCELWSLAQQVSTQGGLKRAVAQGWRVKGDRQGMARQRESPTGRAPRARRVWAPHAAALLHAAAPGARSYLSLPHRLTCAPAPPLRSTITSARICRRRSRRGPAAGSGSSATGTP